jgi:hypothetical protein
MRATRPIRQTAFSLSAAFAALWLASQPVPAAELLHAAKSDRQAVAAAKSDLLNLRPDPAETRAAAMPAPAFGARGTVARKLIDVAVRDDGVWLNSFATRSMPLDAPACAELSDEIVSHLALPAGAVERLADEDLLRQTRVCAVNGSLLVTCYAGAATVSLRPPHMGDGCGG